MMAQEEYEPFIVEGKVWYYDYVTGVGTTRKSYTYKMYFNGDTIIGGKSCKYLIEERPNTALYVTGACYEEDGKVWMIYRRLSNSPQPRLLFDFSCHEDDTLTNLYCWGDDSFKVEGVETVSSFYDHRSHYKDDVIDTFQPKAYEAAVRYESLRTLDTPAFLFLGESFLRLMKADYGQCMQMMRVLDKDLEAFTERQQKYREAARGDESERTIESALEQSRRRNALQQAREAGAKELE